MPFVFFGTRTTPPAEGKVDSIAEAAGMTADAELLRRYLHDRDDAAFAAIVRKHGPMVTGPAI